MILTLSGGLNATTSPVDWDSPSFGGTVHVAAYIDAEPGERDA